MTLSESINKPLVKTKVFLGVVLAMIPDLISGVNEIINLGILPPKVVMGLHIGGAALALFGRFTAKAKVSGVF